MKRIWLRRVRFAFRTRDIEIDDDSFLAAADDDSFDRLILGGVQLLMRNKWRDINKIARTCLLYKFKLITPTKPGASANNINYRFQFAVMVRAGFCIGMNHYGAGPKFLRANFGVRDGFGASHSWSLRRIGVELAGANDAKAVILPIGQRVGSWIGHFCVREYARIFARAAGNYPVIA